MVMTAATELVARTEATATVAAVATAPATVAIQMSHQPAARMIPVTAGDAEDTTATTDDDVADDTGGRSNNDRGGGAAAHDVDVPRARPASVPAPHGGVSGS